MKTAEKVKNAWFAILALTVVVPLFSSCEEQKPKPARKDPLAANHTSWLFIGKDSGSRYFYYNQKLVRITDLDSTVLWIKSIDASNGSGAPSDQPYSLFRLEVSCPREEYRILQYFEVDSSGERKELESEPEPIKWSAVIPETVGYVWYTSACSTPEVIIDKTWKAVRDWRGTSRGQKE